MVSDLNLKKSWNPRLLKNRTKVWEKERQLLSERRDETAHEDANKELPTKYNQSKSVRIDWMYKNPAEHQSGGDGDSCKNDHLNKLPKPRNNRTTLQDSSYTHHNSSSPSLEKPATSIDSTLLKNDPIFLLSQKGSLHRQPQVSKHKSHDFSRISKTRLNSKKR
ncbi:hypothetical protein KL918_003871 [Ogataea parapolymorpha]|uniref:Pre-mRNA-splicing factor CWC25 n=1 Tax=Ogataea parapolymorpha (strain ATCC 26012 / BCRC 20466 / JCM 22074 / NRRL Y-7560 / DL-1) TaxID=871575 RepID=W1QCW8_OGAPD|nr:hypothetical protein HPODL_04012 [Ogataea parapolymorpha DL-1]ESW98384.1 hypothetical protein HPODL_04012 [Ogataea parapolymorpha DL-1]KAG7865883.1 hypothetical protein KL918_003871 [Ogataea parapolymorpha]KAG7874964.1 hypothetical protein KL916_001209 [Ogataea parapolymorpha]